MTGHAGEDLTIAAVGGGQYRVQLPSRDGRVDVVLEMDDAAGVSDGRLQDNESTARATVLYLLTHQDPEDLPPRLELGDVVAAYPDAVDRIEALLE
ncbi:MAG TPA: hypothetical protein VFK68_12690 [Propionibacteriaceae bacterium]|nr:hypothetical protein [Propionibacteriaceae bacterium]